MKITAKVSFSGLEFSAIPGQVLDLPENIAEDLIRAGYAEGSNEDKRSNAGTDTMINFHKFFF